MPSVKSIFLLLLTLYFYPGFAQNRVIDSLQKIIDQGRNDLENNFALNNIASEYARIDMAKAKPYLLRSINLATQLKNDIVLSNAYSQMVTLQMNMGKKDSAQHYLQQLRNLSDGSAPDAIKSSYNLAAGLFYKKMGDYKSALPFMIKSLQDNIATYAKYKTTATKTSIAGSYLNIGNTYMDMGNYKNALRYHLEGLKVFEEVDNQRGISFCYQSVGNDFFNLGRYKDAIPYTAKSIALKKELNDKRGVSISTAQYGKIYKELDDYDKAVYYLNDAVVSFHEMKLTPDEANTMIELGKIAALKKDIAQAGLYFDAARDLAVQIKDSSLMISIEAEKIATQNSVALQNKSEQKLMVNLETAVKTEDKGKELSSYQYLADYYANNRQYDKALEYTNKLHQANDSLQSRDVEVQIKKMEEQFNFDKKEKEIALLKKDQQLSLANLQKQRSFQYGAIIFLAMLLVIGFLVINRYRIVQRSKRMIEMERMRNNIARDLHDDIGSTITSINILSKVALQQQANGETMEAANMQKIKDRSAAIMESMGDIVWAINPQNDTFDQMIFRMKEFAAEILEPLNITYTFEESGNFSSIKMDIKKRKDFYLLFKEALNNAVKYSNCNKLTILLNRQPHELQLEVQDNGIGFNELVVRQGNGIGNMKERAASMEGKIIIASAPGKGTHIKLRVPIT